MLTNPKKYNLFEISPILLNIFKYTDEKSCINFSLTCKKYQNSHQIKTLIYKKRLIQILKIDEEFINTIQHESNFLNLNFNNKFSIYNQIFNITFYKMINENKYNAEFTTLFFDFMYKIQITKYRIKFLNYVQNILNQNIEIIQNKTFWKNVLNMRYHTHTRYDNNGRNGKQYFLYDINRQKYIETTI